ncbi:hypothetical protein ACFYNL_28240 [Streptomyces sp. NPDC007808]|uniref:hypothetical protein n=1 Tax=Streptomyces sp. NPDC007808 TaxID=3364779 RepID=UPI0036C7A23D
MTSAARVPCLSPLLVLTAVPAASADGTTTPIPTPAVRADGVLGRVLHRAPRPLTTALPPGSRTRLTEPWPDRPAPDAVDVRLTVRAAGGASDTAESSAGFVPGAPRGAWGVVSGAAGCVVAAGAFLAVRRRGCRTDDESTGAGT